MSGFCTQCGHRVTSFEGLSGCPDCGTTSMPCNDANQVTVQVNWHELRVLVIWAENYARFIEDQTPGCEQTVVSIARRLENQHPDRALDCPLTLAGELRQIADQYPGTEVIGIDDLQRAMEKHQRINDIPPSTGGTDDAGSPRAG